MANKEYRDINDFYFVQHKKEPEPKPKPEPENIEEIDEQPVKNEPELKISEGIFVHGPDSFDFLKECSVKVNVEFINPEKKSAKIDFSLFSLYAKEGKEPDKDSEYDHKYQVSAHTSKSEEGVYYAEAKIPQLWYDENYYNDSEKPADATCKYFFRADHPKALERNKKSELLEMPQKKTDDKLIFYIPASDEYLEVDANTAFNTLEKECEDIDSLANDIQAIREIVSFEEQIQKADAVEEKLLTLLGTKSQISAKDTFEEILLVKNDKNSRWGKPVSYVKRQSLKERAKTGESGKSQFRRVRRSYEYEKEELKEFLGLKENQNSGGSANPLETVKATFWKKEAGGDGVWKFTARDENGNVDAAADNDYFSISAEAQLLRFTAGVSIASDVTSVLKGKPKFSIGGQANLTFSLVEGAVEGSYSFPNKAGVNILALFTSTEKLTGLVKEGRVCSILLKAILSAYTFVGASATAIVGLPNINFTDGKKEAEVGGEIGVGATATGGGSLACAIEWKGHNSPKFAGLGDVKGTAEASFGVAGNLQAQIGYNDGVFFVKIGARAVVGIGGKLGTEIGLGIDEGFKFVAYILRSFDYHYVEETMGEAFDTCVKMSILAIANVTEKIGKATEKGKALVLHAFEIGTEVKDEMIEAILGDERKEEIKFAAPEATGSIILGIMEIPQESDFDAIIKLLQSADSDHELKSILRTVGLEDIAIKASRPKRGTPLYSKWQGDALQEGIRRLLGFGEGIKKLEFAYPGYRGKVKRVLEEKNIEF